MLQTQGASLIDTREHKQQQQTNVFSIYYIILSLKSQTLLIHIKSQDRSVSKRLVLGLMAGFVFPEWIGASVKQVHLFTSMYQPPSFLPNMYQGSLLASKITNIKNSRSLTSSLTIQLHGVMFRQKNNFASMFINT